MTAVVHLLGGLFAFVGLAVLVVAVITLVRGHLDWARLSGRRPAGWALGAALVLLMVGGALSPQHPTVSTAAGTAPATSPIDSPTPTSDPSQTPAPILSPTAAASASASDSGAADPEANPTSTASVSTAGLAAPAVLAGAASLCRAGDPLANVYHPYRLQVVTPCATAAGVVQTVRREDDRDYHIDVHLDPAYNGMLDVGNLQYQRGDLVVEIVAADEPGCAKGLPPLPAHGDYNYGLCTGADETPPALGTHVWITGPYVIDHFHNWAEIHPAWGFSNTQPASQQTPAPAAASAAPASAAPAAPVAPAPPASAASCSASVDNASPAQYSTVTVAVTTQATVGVTATAHYKSTTTTHTGTADGTGHASIAFKLSRATLGYTVAVTVTTSNGASCQTSFTPQ